MLRYQLFPRSFGTKAEVEAVIDCFQKNYDAIKSPENNLNSDGVLKIISDDLKKLGFKVEETIKEILRYIANIISIDTLEIERSNYKSEIINKLIQNNKQEIIDLAKNKNGKIEVPSSVLSINNSIKLKIQNEVFITLQKQKNNPASTKLPSKVDYEICKEWLNKLYNLFKWQIEEKQFKSKAQLDYYAMLMNQWINGISLNQIISQSISYYSTTKRKIPTGYNESGLKLEPFNESKQHINILIGSIIDDIEY